MFPRVNSFGWLSQRLSRGYSTCKDDIFFGTNSLNRHSFLRSDPIFIAKSITSPYSKYIFLDKLSPVFNMKERKLHLLDYETIGSLNREILDDWVDQNRERSIELQNSPLIHFLGLDDKNFSPFKFKQYSGTPYYAIDISKHDSLRGKIYSNNSSIMPLTTKELINENLNYYDSNIFAQAKMYFHWINSTPYCKGCGSKTIPINASSQLLCSSTSDIKCPVKLAPGFANASYPRLDPAIITCVLNGTRDKVLLTRMNKYPRAMYTHIAGFIEPGETVENAVKREVWEEAGLKVLEVDIVKSQPWPYPANIMLGCVAIVEETEIQLDNDFELQEAFWIDIKNVKKIINESEGIKEGLSVFNNDLGVGIPNDKTLANKLFHYVVEKYT